VEERRDDASGIGGGGFCSTRNPDAVTAKNPPVDASIMKEVEKAEKEQSDEMATEKAFAVGKEVVRDDGSGKPLKGAHSAKKQMATKSLLKAVGWKK
jgi:hypothetical protein